MDGKGGSDESDGLEWQVQVFAMEGLNGSKEDEGVEMATPLDGKSEVVRIEGSRGVRAENGGWKIARDAGRRGRNACEEMKMKPKPQVTSCQ